MSPFHSPAFEEDCDFVPIDLHNESEAREFQDQRFKCGWDFKQDCIDKWREMMDKKEKTIFWIILPSRNNLRAGHISLDSLSNSKDMDLYNLDRSKMTIKTFFIWPEYRALGLGRKAMDAMEDAATKEPYGSPNCKTMIVDTYTKSYWTDPILIAERKKWNDDQSDERINEDWYVRRGYVKWKEQPTYQEIHPKTGEMRLVVASFLRKDVK